MSTSNSGRCVKCFGVIAVIPKRVQFSTAKEDKVIAGKWDYGAGGELGQYFPGEKAGRAWDEGWRRRYAGGSIGDNPHAAGTAENNAWADGFNEAAANSGGVRRMPATTGTPPP